jgi:anti-anti-sigma factor
VLVHEIAEAPRPVADRHLRLSVDVLTGVIRLGGDLDRGSAYHLADALSALRSSPSPVWTLDLQDVSFCDAEGMRVLDRAREMADLSGRSLHLTGMRPVLVDLLTLVRSLRSTAAVLRSLAAAAP